MTTQMVTTANGKRFIATQTRRKELAAIEAAKAETLDPLTLSDIMWSIAIYGGFFLSFIFALVMLGGVLS